MTDHPPNVRADFAAYVEELVAQRRAEQAQTQAATDAADERRTAAIDELGALLDASLDRSDFLNPHPETAGPTVADDLADLEAQIAADSNNPTITHQED